MKIKQKKQEQIRQPIQNKKQTRTKRNQKKYGQKVIIKSYHLHKAIIILLILSLLINALTIYHFIAFNHNKVKIITKIKEKKVVPENIVFLGDSITYQYDLEKYYGEKYYVVNSGINGNTTDDILNNLKERVYDYNPSKVFLLIGTNDIQKKKKEEEIVSNIQKIVDEIKTNRPETKVYIESIYPVDNKHKSLAEDRKNTEIESINSKLKEYCKNAKIDFIDIYPRLIDEEGNLKEEYTKDGLHISNEGYNIITEIIKEKLI